MIVKIIIQISCFYTNESLSQEFELKRSPIDFTNRKTKSPMSYPLPVECHVVRSDVHYPWL